ncbi:hypothetical protein CAPTEDRAFT_212423 [Capitella teleta]|uniref:Uncharacterized protein n=1 Tax=Capitella teleta TaxID=283909 RepID=R7U7T0_CAPTE|nr:hypothetical protein CAPTEDRAFT_212423 [Capitella teleta]|eukprot:ELU02211.1 hypothetical protein CAPTEDRAFT_212423 [Capitella teleta]
MDQFPIHWNWRCLMVTALLLMVKMKWVQVILAGSFDEKDEPVTATIQPSVKKRASQKPRNLADAYDSFSPVPPKRLKYPVALPHLVWQYIELHPHFQIILKSYPRSKALLKALQKACIRSSSNNKTASNVCALSALRNGD